MASKVNDALDLWKKKEIKDVDEGYIKSYMSDSRNYFTQAKSDIDGLTWESATNTDKINSRKASGTDLLNRSNKIRVYLNVHKDSIDKDTYNSWMAQLDADKKNYSDIAGLFDSAYDDYSQYEGQQHYDIYHMSFDELQAKIDSSAKAPSQADIQAAENRSKTVNGRSRNPQASSKRTATEGRSREYQVEKKPDSKIAYTTKSGQNITWQDLYDQKLDAQTFNADYTEYSSRANWDEFSEELSDPYLLDSDWQLMYSITANNVPYRLDDAKKQGYTEVQWKRAKDKRDYIARKYNLDLSDKEQTNVILGEKMKALESQKGELDTFEHIDMLTDEERRVLNYIANLQGRKAALQWFNKRKHIYDERARTDMAQRYQGIGEEHPLFGSVLSLGSNLAAGGEALVDGASYLFTGEMDHNESALITNSLRSGAMQAVDWEIGNWDAYDFLYSTGMSMADSVVSRAFGPTGGAISQGLGAAGHATNNALDRGMSSQQAFWTGVAAGTAEAVFEKYSISNFDALKEVPAYTLKDYAKNIGKSMLTNASEETLTEIANITYDALMNGDFSQWDTTYRQYLANGYSNEEALGKTFGDNFWQVAEAGLSGALMGFGFGAAGSAGSIVDAARANRQYNRQTRAIAERTAGNDANVNAMLDTADGLYSGATGRVKNNLEKRIGKVRNNATAKNVQKLYKSMDAATKAQNRADIVSSLKSKGISNTQAGRIADTIIAMSERNAITENNLGIISDEVIDVVYGGNLSKRDRSDLEAKGVPNAIEAAINEFINNDGSTVRQRSSKLGALQRTIDTNHLKKAVVEDLVKNGIEPERAAKLAEVAVEDIVSQQESAMEAIPAASPEGLWEQVQSAEGQVLYEDQPVQVASVKSAGNGQLIVQLADGASVDAAQLSFPSQGEQLLYQVVGKIADSADTAEQLLASQQTGEASARIYARAIEQAYVYGRHQIPLQQLVKESPYVRALTPQQRQKAYDLGKEAGAKSADQDQNQVNDTYNKAEKVLGDQQEKTPRTYTARAAEGVNVKKFSPQQKAAYQLMQNIAPAVKGNMVAYEGGKEWGYYNHTTDEIYINVNATWSKANMMAFTLGHELAHRAKAGSPKQFKAFADFLVEQYGKQGASVNDMIIEQITAAEREGRQMTTEEALEEVVADACQRMLLDTDAGQRLAEWGAQSSQNQGFLAKVKKIITDLLDRLRRYFKNVDPDSKAAKEFAKIDANAKQILADMFVDMSIDAGEKLSTIKAAGMLDQLNKNTATEGGRLYKSSVGYDYTKSFAEQVDDFKAGLIPNRDTLLIGATPKIYQTIGFNPLPMTINKTHVEYALYGTKNVEHHIGETMLKQLPKALEKPIAVIVSQSTPTTSVVVLVSLQHNGEQVIAPVYLDGAGRKNGVSIDSNAVTSVHGRGNAIKGLLKNALNEEAKQNIGVFYWDKKAATALLTTAGVTMPQGLSLSDGYVHSIREKNSPVKPKFNDVTETQQFKRWFGDWQKHPENASKIVNSDGAPKVMYHGTRAENGEFYEFDSSKAVKKGGLGLQAMGKGNYFTAKKLDGTERYGSRVIAAYLDIKKPFVYEGGKSLREQVAQKFGIETEELTSDELQQEMRDRKYDGVVEYDADGKISIAVVFDSNQIKSATDNIGTFDGSNPDIRYKTPVAEDLSPRELLLNTVEGMVANSDEYRELQKYRRKIQELNATEEHLERLNEQLRQLYFAEGGRDYEMINKLEGQRAEALTKLNRYDSQLINLENTKPIRDIVNRMKQAAYDKGFRKAKDYYKQKADAREEKLKQHYQESRRNAVERHDKAQIRQQIRKDVQRLASLLNKGNKQKNVKQELQAFAGAALRTAQGTFLNNYNEYDMIRNGVHNRLMNEHQPIFDRCRELLTELDKLREEIYAEPGPDNIHDKWDPEAALRREDREEALKKELAKNMAILRNANVFRTENEGLQSSTAEELMNELLNAYSALQNSELAHVRGVFSQVIYDQIDGVRKFLAGKAVKDMTTVELKELQQMYRLVLHVIRTSNQIFTSERAETVSGLGNSAVTEFNGLYEAGKKNKKVSGMIRKLLDIGWQDLTPVYAFRALNNKVMMKLYKSLRGGEQTAARDIEDAKTFWKKTAEKYEVRNWSMAERQEFTDSNGNTFSLSLGQLLSLYALSKREQAVKHLEIGGLKLDTSERYVETTKDRLIPEFLKYAERHVLKKEDLRNICEKGLTAEQRAFVDTTQAYLTEVMGEKGNEVSMALYGIELYKEKIYFPIRVANNERYVSTELIDQNKLKNSGFTKTPNPEAGNALILSDYSSVWTDHVSKMALYHGMTLPMEDMDRVLNYGRGPKKDKDGNILKDENGSVLYEYSDDSVSIAMEKVFGKHPESYIRELMKQLNGGIRSDPAEKGALKWMSKFKKASVILSASVWIQQHTSIYRAMAHIDQKYFWQVPKLFKARRAQVEEMKKYCPVAIIKEMGGFSMGMGSSVHDYITGKDLRDVDGMIGSLKWAVKKVDDWMGLLPARADENTWMRIWIAVKRETADKNPSVSVGSEAFYKIAAERFDEIISLTQVYDSTLSKSEWMRSNGGLAKMITQFAAEPTLALNMAIDAGIQTKQTGKLQLRTAAALLASIIANSVCSALIYAMRDDDEDETFIEKYFAAFHTELLEGLNPITYIPLVRDIWSLLQGYDIGRSDMEVFAGLADSLKKLCTIYQKEDVTEKEIWNAWAGVLDYGAAAFGIPVKNVRREINGVINTWNALKKDFTERDTTALSFKDATQEAFWSSTPVVGWFFGEPKGKRLVDAIQAGDQEYERRLRGSYKTVAASNNAITNEIEERFKAGQLSEDVAIDFLRKHAGKDEEKARDKVAVWKFDQQCGKNALEEESWKVKFSNLEKHGISLEVYQDYCNRKQKTKVENVKVIHSLPLTPKQKDELYLSAGYAESTIEETPWH